RTTEPAGGRRWVPGHRQEPRYPARRWQAPRYLARRWQAPRYLARRWQAPRYLARRWEAPRYLARRGDTAGHDLAEHVSSESFHRRGVGVGGRRRVRYLRTWGREL